MTAATQILGKVRNHIADLAGVKAALAAASAAAIASLATTAAFGSAAAFSAACSFFAAGTFQQLLQQGQELGADAIGALTSSLGLGAQGVACTWQACALKGILSEG